jgi:hypothetical protein
MVNPNPKNKFQKGDKRAGRPLGLANVISRDIKTIIRKAAEEVGFIRRVPELEAEGNPTGRTELKFGKDGEAGYLRWLAANHPGVFGALYGRLIPLDINAKVEEKKVVRYETKVSEEEIAIDLESGGGEFVGTPTIDFAIRATRPINALTELE